MDTLKVMNSNQLKLIAIIAMTIDHLAWTFFPGMYTMPHVLLLHGIGRLTAPIMWFFLAEGFHYTHNAGRYLLRLFVFAAVSHFAYAFAFGMSFLPFQSGSFFNQTSVMWGLFCGGVLLTLWKQDNLPLWLKIVFVPLCCLIAYPSDWSFIPVLAPLCFYLTRGKFRYQALCMVAVVLLYAFVYWRKYGDHPEYAMVQLFALMTIPILATYNGERGKWKGMKWLFYLYYPGHLVLIGLLRMALVNGWMAYPFPLS